MNQRPDQSANSAPVRRRRAASYKNDPVLAGTGDVLCRSGVTTLADVVSRYEDSACEHPAAAKIRSCARGVSRVVGLSLEDIPANPKALRPLLVNASPAAVGVTRNQWRDIQSVLYRGLRDLGVEIVSRRDETPLSSAWDLLFHLLKDRRLEVGLGKFLKFCSRKGVRPECVCPQTFLDFHRELEERTGHPNPRRVYRQTAKLWNAAAATIPEWPKLVLSPDTDERRYTLPLEAFAPTLVEGFEAFLSAGELNDEFADYAPQVRPVTTRNRRIMLVRAASAVVLSGTPASELTSIDALCTPDAAAAILRFFRDRHPERAYTEGMFSHVYLLCSVALWRGDVAAAKAIRAKIRPVEKRHGVGRGGVRPKNREKLRQFDQRRSLAAIVNLPDEVLRCEGRERRPNRRQAVRVMYALLVGLLLYIPMRSKNLVELELARHLVDVGAGRNRTVRIRMPRSMMKSGRPFEAPFPPHLLPLLDAWLRRHRACVGPVGSKYLFPNSHGEVRNRNALATQVTDFIERETGLRMNLHLFRHLAAKIMLEADPNNMESVRQLLHHSSSRVTERAYADFRSDASFRSYDRAIRTMPARAVQRTRLGNRR